MSDTQQPAQLSHDRTRSSHSQSPVVDAGSAVHAAASCDQWEQVTPPQVVQDIAVEQERNRRRESSDFGVSSAAMTSRFDTTVTLFNFNDGTALRIFEHHTFVGPLIQGGLDLRGLDPGRVTSLALLPDGLRFVSASADKTARIAYHGLAPSK